MQRHALRLSRPIYEGLPWIYIACGIAALGASYLLEPHWVSLIAGMVGLLGLVGGIVVLLRRREYRELRSRYANPDSLTGEEKD